MKNSIMLLLGTAILLGSTGLSADSSIEDALKQSSSGTVSSRFRGGYFVGLGYQGRIGGSGDTKIQGFLLEGGVYALINPVRNFFDIEIGISGKYNTGMTSSSSDSNEKTYYAGLKQITAYSGLSFRFGESKTALAIGVSKALYIDEVQTDELKENNIEKHDLQNGIGAYVEYQTDEINGNIFFVRAEVEKIDVVGDYETSKDTIGSILVGMKY